MDYSKLLGSMRANGMTQSIVAQKIGVSPTTLNKKLRGHTDFTQSEICDLCRVLAIPDAEIPNYFFYAKTLVFARFRNHKEVNPMENKDEKNEELLNKQLQLLAEKSMNADADTLVSLTDVMCKVYKVLNGDL